MRFSSPDSNTSRHFKGSAVQCTGDLNRGGRGFESHTAAERQFKQQVITDRDHSDRNRLGVPARTAQWGQKAPPRGQEQADVGITSSAATGQLPVP